MLFRLLGKAVSGREQLHQVLIGAAQQIHDVSGLSGLRIRVIQAGQEHLGKPSPFPVFQAADPGKLLVIQHGRDLFQPASEHPPVLTEDQDVLNDLLHQIGIAGFLQERPEIMVGSERGFDPVIDSADLVSDFNQSFAQQIVSDLLFGHGFAGSHEQIPDQPLLDFRGDGIPVNA